VTCFMSGRTFILQDHQTMVKTDHTCSIMIRKLLTVKQCLHWDTGHGNILDGIHVFKHTQVGEGDNNFLVFLKTIAEYFFLIPK
jgi:hypothetical protein